MPPRPCGRRGEGQISLWEKRYKATLENSYVWSPYSSIHCRCRNIHGIWWCWQGTSGAPACYSRPMDSTSVSTPPSAAIKSFFDKLTAGQREELERVRAALPRLDEVTLNNANPGPTASER